MAGSLWRFRTLVSFTSRGVPHDVSSECLGRRRGETGSCRSRGTSGGRHCDAAGEARDCFGHSPRFRPEAGAECARGVIPRRWFLRLGFHRLHRLSGRDVSRQRLSSRYVLFRVPRKRLATSARGDSQSLTGHRGHRRRGSVGRARRATTDGPRHRPHRRRSRAAPVSFRTPR